MPTNKMQNHIFYGWWNVLAAFVGLALSYAMFTVFIFGTFVGPLEREFGWQRGEMSLAPTLANIAVVFASPLIGSLVDRLGVRRVMLVSTVLMALTVASMSQLGGDIRYFYAAYLIIPLLGAGTLPLTYSRIIIAWFSRRRGLALGIALSGFGVGATVMPALGQYMIDMYDWRTAYLLFAAGILLLPLPLLYFLLKESPAELGMTPDGDMENQPPTEAADVSSGETETGLAANQAFKTRSFWLIFSSFALIGIGITSILAHLVPMLIGRGVEPQTAAWCMSTLGVGLIFGRIFSGWLMDRFFAPYVAAVFLTGLAVGAAILASGTASGIVFVAAALVGLATGSEISEIAYIVSRYFGTKAFGLIYGIMFAAFQLGSAAGAYAMGRYFDFAGDYTNALWLIVGLVSAGTLLIAMLGKYPTTFSSPGGR